MAIVQVFTSFRGRIGRLTFLLGLVALSVALTLAFALVRYAIGSCSWYKLTMSPGFALVVRSTYAPLYVKRAHDLDKSDWWCLGVMVALAAMPMAWVFSFALMLGAPQAGSVFLAVTGAATLYGLVQWLRLLFAGGAPGANQFGHPPRLNVDLLGSQEDEISAERIVAPVARSKAVVHSPRPAMAGSGGFGRRGV